MIRIVYDVAGRLAATGSGDSSIKLLDVDKMMTQTAVGHQQEVHPVIRSLYDHGDVSGRGSSRCTYMAGVRVGIDMYVLKLL